MKKILTVIMVMLVCFAGCVAAGPRPPIELPFAVHQAGATVSTELRIVERHKYPFFLVFMFNEKDRADQERVRKLVGYHQKDRHGKFIEPGIPIPSKITINIIDSSGERLFLKKEVLTMGMDSGPSINDFDRKVDLIELAPGLYRVTVQGLKDIPELKDTKVILGIYPRQRGKS